MKRRKLLGAAAASAVIMSARSAPAEIAAVESTNRVRAAAGIQNVLLWVPGLPGTPGETEVVFNFALTSDGTSSRDAGGSVAVDFYAPPALKNAAIVAAVQESALVNFGETVEARDVLLFGGFNNP